MSRRRVLLTLSVALCGALGSPSWGDDARGACQRAYQRKQYAAAVATCRRAYDATGDPALLYAIAQAFRRMGDPADAVVYYRKFLDAKGPGYAGRADVEALLAQSEEAAGAAATRPPVAAQPVPVPAPASNATATGPPQSQPTVAPVGSPATVPVAPPAPASPPPSRPWYRRPASLAWVGGGAAAVAGGGVLLALAAAAGQAGGQARTLGDFRSDRFRSDAYEAAGIGLAIAGAAAITTGVWLGRRATEGRAQGAAVVMTPGGVAFATWGAF